jgi:hypothetical protein
MHCDTVVDCGHTLHIVVLGHLRFVSLSYGIATDHHAVVRFIPLAAAARRVDCRCGQRGVPRVSSRPRKGV